MTDVKDTNPKDAVGTRKAPFSTVPARVTAEIGLAMLEGARKYGRHNYRVAGIRASVYYDAAMRHLTLWWEGQNIDPDSGLPHIVKALACLYVLRDAQTNGMCTDDRPPSLVDQDWVAELNKIAGQLIDKYPDPKAPYVRQTAEKEVAEVVGQLVADAAKEAVPVAENLGEAALDAAIKCVHGLLPTLCVECALA